MSLTESVESFEEICYLQQDMDQISVSSDPHFSILKYDQLVSLDQLLNGIVYINPVVVSNLPTLKTSLRWIIESVVSKLKKVSRFAYRDVRINGGAATHVLARNKYQDVDVIFGVNLDDVNAILVREVVLNTLKELLQKHISKSHLGKLSDIIDNRCLMDTYVSKMIRIGADGDVGDRWCLISLHNEKGRSIDLKFVDVIKRCYEFSVDSFQIILDSLFDYYQCVTQPTVAGVKKKELLINYTQAHSDHHLRPSPFSIFNVRSNSTGEANNEFGDDYDNSDGRTIMDSNCYPTVMVYSAYGDFEEAFYHLKRRTISTESPEQIRGGGLLTYCKLISRGYKLDTLLCRRNIERVMCARFLIDFGTNCEQKSRIERYLSNHFGHDKYQAKFDFLQVLYQVVQRSAVCVMKYDRCQTLQMISDVINTEVYGQVSPPLSR